MLMPDADDPVIRFLREVAEAHPSGIHRDGASLLTFSAACGWSQVYDNRGGVVLNPPDGGVGIKVPVETGLQIGKLRQHVRKIARHRGPSLFSDVPIGILVHEMVSHYKLDPDHAQIFRGALADLAPLPPTPVAAAEPEPDEHRKPRKRRIARSEPWAAHGTTNDEGAETYPSPAVLERTWTDGSVDYACRWKDCDYESDSPRSVASHYTSHRRGEGRQPQPQADGIDPDWTPSKKARVRRLRSELEAALAAAAKDGIDWDAEWIAAWIIDHRVGTLAADRGDDADTELTAEQVLDKIVALADRGRAKTLREQIDALQEQVDAQERERERIAALEAHVNAAEAEVGTLRQERDSLRDAAGKWEAIKGLVTES